ncbi:LysR family transcriptional regulator [Streptomyces tsukubensis]|uniref:LysR family transcriptional regulator n=1 Tax=Streptomyces tsukubensis TaxID=83656 RepID=A0A1V4A0K2_9ACTN|nr:LysR family transcriptional regulator [Streptomyces tsukubensis]OON72357.1 LysR family transcriptional regulator [Streptomyces tsukubensis]
MRHLRCFLAVSEEGSVTGAAVRLRLTQPAVSRALAALEQALAVRLVDRSTHHLELTAEGETFRPKAERAVAAFEEALDSVREVHRPLRLGHAWSAAGRSTTRLLRHWAWEHPDVPLELLRVDDRTAGLTRGSVDAALLRGDVGTPGLLTETLYTEPRVAAVPADSPLAGREEITLADLRTYTIALNTISGSTTPALWPAGERPTGTLTVGNTDDWLAAIAAGRAVGVTASATAGMHPNPGVVYVPLADAPPLPVVLAWRDGHAHPAVRDLVALARRVVGEP